MASERKTNIAGVFAISLSTIAAAFWAFWGIIENFHEGWYFESFLQNIGLMLVQYLSPMIILILLSILSFYKPKIGAIVYIIAGIALFLFVNNLLLPIPFFLLAILFWFGKIANPTKARRIILMSCLISLMVFGAEPVHRVSNRYSDDFKGARFIKGYGVELVWAPQGPGWPQEGYDWYEVDSICRHLNYDGKTLNAGPQNIWRLPTLDEAIRSMSRFGHNAKGRYNPEQEQPEYDIRPDKESPLWDIHSQVIYWWTATSKDDKAYIIVYDGKIWLRDKDFGPMYLSFRAVRDP